MLQGYTSAYRPPLLCNYLIITDLYQFMGCTSAFLKLLHGFAQTGLIFQAVERVVMPGYFKRDFFFAQHGSGE